MVCRCLCKCCGWFLVMSVLWVGVLFIPQAETTYWRLVQHVAPAEVSLQATPQTIAFHILNILGFMRTIVAVGPQRAIGQDGIVYRSPPPGYANDIYDGPGLHMGLVPSFGFVLQRTSHEAAKRVHYDRELDRPYDFILGAINTTVAAKFIPPGAQPLLLQRRTIEPEWWTTRDLYVASIPALGRHPPQITPFMFPDTVKGLTEEKFCSAVNDFNLYWGGMLEGDPAKLVPTELGYVIGFNFFRQVYGIDIKQEDMDLASELQNQVAALLGNNADEKAAARGLEIQKHFETLVRKSKWSEKFMAEAKKRGMDGLGRLRALILEFFVAGYGAPGSALQTFYVIKMLQDDKQRLSLYVKDPEAFILETARLRGGGGGGVFYSVKKTTKWTLGSGHVVSEKKGDLAGTALLPAGMDPAVWGGPSKDIAHAAKFLPGRENRERLIPWMNELQDIRKCPNMTGCEAAPRFCIGTELTQRLARMTTDFYVKKCTGTAAQKDEM